MSINIFEIIVLTLINSGGIFLIIILVANSLKDRLHRWLTMMTITIIGWVNFAYLGYIDPHSEAALLFYRINFAFVAMFFFTEYMLYVEGFSKIRNKILKYAALGTSILFVFLAFFTNSLISGVTSQEWGNEAILEAGNDFFGLYALLGNLALMALMTVKYLRLRAIERSKALFFLAGTSIFVFSNIVFNVLVPELIHSVKYQHFGDYSSVFFLLLTAYAILRRKFMNVRIALTALLIGVVSMFLIIDILTLSDSLAEQGLKSVIFVFFVAISILLVRSVLNEIRQREQIEELSREQKDIIDVMGHEIRTPLTAIVQEVNLNKQVVIPKAEDWKAGKLTKDEEKEFIELVVDGCDTIDKASHQATHLVSDMLETARLDKKRFELEYENFDIIEEAKTAVQIAEKALTEDNVKISFESKLKTLEVNADKTRIRESIDNLISNAVKYKDPNKEKTTIDVSVNVDGRQVIVSVKDNGRGIAPEDISKLGKKFFRLDSKMNGSTIKRPGGTGLGLFVVKGIMEYHKGSLSIKSDGLGKGSEFILKFPKHQ